MPRSLRSLSFVFSAMLPAMAALANDSGGCNQIADAHLGIKGCSTLLKSGYFDRAVEPNPNSQDAYRGHGVAYKIRSPYDQAIIDFNRAIERNPNNWDAYHGRATAYFNKGEYDKAIADLDRAIELSPNHETVYTHRGYVYYVKGEYGKAIADFNRAVELNPKDAITLQLLGVAKFDAGDFKGASSDSLRLLALKDNAYAMLHRYLAGARAGETLAAAELQANSGRLKTGEWPYAVIELYLGKRSLELTLDAAAKPEEKCQAQFYAGEWYVLQNKPAEAEAMLNKALETCPKNFLGYTNAQAELKRLKP